MAESAPTPAGRVLNDWLIDVEAKQDWTLSDKGHAEEIHVFVIYYADDARHAYAHGYHEAGEEELVT